MKFKTFGFNIHYLDDVADKITEKVADGWTFHQVLSFDTIGNGYTVYNVLMSK